jgi:PAS domain S-box-containing protein
VDDPSRSEARQLALLVDQAIEYAIFMLDPEGRIQTWNPAAERLKGYSREEILGKHFSVLYTEEDRTRDHPAHELEVATREGRHKGEGWRVRKDGSRFWANVAITALRDERGELVGFGMALQTTARELAEFRRLVSSVRDYAIFMLDPTGHILTWNTGARHLKGYEPEEIIGRHFSTFYTDEDRARDHPAYELEVAIREGRYEEEGWRVRKDGTTFWASVTITAIRDDDGGLTGFAKVTRDLTERKRSEDALQQAVADLRAANEELDRFASVAAHDMTDPLRTISGFAEVLVETDPSPEERQEYTRHILDSSLRLTAMLQGLLAYARAGSRAAGAESVDLPRAIDQVRDDLAIGIRDSHAELVVEIPAGAAVLADPNDLRVVLQNLVSNAIKFGDAQAPVVSVAAERAADTWLVSVRDNGGGIAAEDQARIFNAFERGGSGAGRFGYGLGLAICQRLVERHGGQISVESDSEGGATLWFKLPAA